MPNPNELHEIEFIITGRPASKKNSRVNLPDGRSFPSKAYRTFNKDAQLQMLQLISRIHRLGFETPIKTPVMIDYFFHQRGKYRQDVSNAMASIEDCLQDARVIEDDDLIEAGTFAKKGGADEWSTFIRIRW